MLFNLFFYFCRVNELQKPESCPTCGRQELSGTFCPACGQKLSAQRFTLKRSLSAAIAQVFNLEKGFLHTLRELILRPEWVRDQYLQQGTVRYFHPFRFVFVLATLTALLTILSGAFEDVNQGWAEGYAENGNNTEEGAQFNQTVFKYIQNYLAFIIMLAIPFYALIARLFYRKFKLYFGEHLIIASYAYGLALALSLPFIALYPLPKGPLIGTAVTTIVSLGAMVWVYHRCFRQNIFISVLKMLAITILSTILLIIISGIIGFAVAITGKIAG